MTPQSAGGPISAPLANTEFTALMEALGPWPLDRRVAVACSGGADSLALTVLAAAWGTPLALIVDHGLRPDSAAEAALTAARLGARGIANRILTLRDLRHGPGLAARARAARYAALAAAALAAGCADLLLGHHVRDQAETVLMRRQGGSGDAGQAAMAAVMERLDVRLVRPLLGCPPSRLRATLRAAGMGWVDDPSNTDLATLRARLRAGLADADGTAPATVALAAAAARQAVARARRDAAVAAELAARASIFPQGYAVLSPGPISAAALAGLLRALTGADYAARGTGLRRLAAAPGPATLGGVQLLPPGRLGAGLVLVREAASLPPAVPAVAGARWDRRFILAADAVPPPGAMMGALGGAAAGLRGTSHLPAAVLQALPALWLKGALFSVPLLGWPDQASCAPCAIQFCPALPAAGAPFHAPGGVEPDAPSHLFTGGEPA